MRASFLPLAGLTALLLLPSAAQAELQTFGSDLSAPANIVHEHQADTAFWQTALPGGADPLVPVAGQIKEVRIKGVALRRPDARPAGAVGGETMFHIQAIEGTRFRITSQAFYMPTAGDPQQVSTFAPANFCVKPGDRIAFNTVGGYDAIGAQPENGTYAPGSPYPNGTPLQIFSRVPGTSTEWYEQANGTDNGESMAPHGSGPRESDQGNASSGKLDGQELLMQMTLATGDDRSYECGGPNTYRPTHTDPKGPPKPVMPQRTTLPEKQTVRVSKSGDAGMALFCGPGAGPCVGTVTVTAGRAVIGTAKYSIAQKSTGKLKLRLNQAGRKAFAKKGKLPVTIVAVTAPGGPDRTVAFKTVLRKHKAK